MATIDFVNQLFTKLSAVESLLTLQWEIVFDWLLFD